ncbi:MAG: TIGR03960 family B12-binding radical SAM protein [Clostridiales bacterium]|nr:TIGR03960 family B12-binding radical SAM protein [Clostridiales bacterium]
MNRNLDWLTRVEKPSRYTGGELNMIKKDHADKVRFALCFPDTYEIGMSHMGSRILYHILNERTDCVCERCYTPWPDAMAELKAQGQKLFTLESYTDLDAFDIIGFSLLYELTYSNVLKMLSLAKLPIYAKDRSDDMPLIVAGGPCTVNPEPMADFIDAFMIGDGEEVIETLVEEYKKAKQEGVGKGELLCRLSKIDGFYVPSLYDVVYNEDGTVKAIVAKDGAPSKVKKAIVRDLDKAPFPTCPLVPYTSIIHDRAGIELFRGCTRGCRFCQAGYIYRPMRLREKDTLKEHAVTSIQNTGYEEVSLTSLSSGDYPYLTELIHELDAVLRPEKVSLSLPSLRIDSFLKDYAEGTGSVRKSSLTFAPEAGTQRLRDVINKGVTEEDLLNSVRSAFLEGYTSIKLYFMLGLPTETDEDILGIADLARKVVAEFHKLPKEMRPKPISVTVSASTFVPKPFTPFGWEGQIELNEIMRRQKLLKDSLYKEKRIRVQTHEPYTSVLEAAFSRADRRFGKAIAIAHERGAMLDGWREWMDYDRWTTAIHDAGLDVAFYANRQRSEDEVLPYDHIDIYVNKSFLLRELHRAHRAEVTPYCQGNCQGCGMMAYCGVKA